jgi:hypothetical protein
MTEQIIAPPCEEPEDLTDCVIVEEPEIPSGCIETPSGIKCPDTAPSDVCKPFQLSENTDECIIEDYVEEALGIGGATLNVYKMLGVHEQGQLTDQTGRGTAISGGDATNFPAANAFDAYITAWRSLQKGSGVAESSYVGYDFGIIRLNNLRTRYGEPKDETRDIATLRIKQVSDPNKRVTRVRVERSQDGIKWYGVDIVSLPDCDKLVTVNFRRSVPSRYWRLRPVDFSGGDTDFWSVVALELIDYEQTQISNVQDRLFLENRNRDYQTPALVIKGSYDLIDTQTELSRFGIELPSQTMYITISFNMCVRTIGRPLVIGDIIEMPSETQYSATLEPIKKYMEVTDVGWSTEGYTPGWKPTMLRVVAQPMIASQETQDIFGDLVGQVDSSGLFDEDDGQHPVYQDYSEIGQTVEEEAVQEERAPQRGRDSGNEIAQFSEEEVQRATDVGISITKIGLNPTGLYVEDAMPPNGEDFTMGDTFPTSPTDGDYHRMTYSGLAEDVPDRLYRYSTAKGRWVYLETDRRHEFDGQRKKLQEFITSPQSASTDLPDLTQPSEDANGEDISIETGPTPPEPAFMFAPIFGPEFD